MTRRPTAILTQLTPRRSLLAPLLAAGLLTGLELGSAAGGEPLTLPEAVARAVAASPRVLAAQAEADAAGYDAGAASWSRLPRLEGKIEATRTDHPVHVFGGLLAQERFASENLGTFDPSTGFNLATLNRPDPLTNFRASVTVRQTLWAGGAVTSQLNRGRARADRARNGAARTSEQTVYDTEAAFRGAILAEESLGLLRASLATARAEAARVESLYATGLALQSDRQALEAHVHEAEAALAGALADSVEARSGLGFLLGAEGPIADPLVPPEDAEGEDSPTLAQALEAAPARTDVRAARAGVREAEAGRGLARSGLLPALEIFASAEHNSEEFFGAGGDQWMVGVGTRWALDPGVPGRVRAASAQLRAAREHEATLEGMGRHQVVTAYGRLEAARERARALEAAVAASEASFTLVRERQHEGLATVLELTESQDTLTRTRLARAAARRDFALARAGLRLAAGLTSLPEDAR
jgi:outer membrane protein TolC